MSRYGVMLDLETLDTRATSAILSIGACMMDFEKLAVVDRFYIIVDSKSCIEAGLTTSPSTEKWWSQQSEEARRVFTDPNKVKLIDALIEFTRWTRNTKATDGLEMWGNGSDFDNVILINAFDKCGLEAPWKFFRNRCYRTYKSLYPEVKVDRVGTYHNALDDALTQAETLFKCINKQRNRLA